MRITRLRLRNWRNFRALDLVLQRRTFLVGPNACGKSNLLDAMLFLRDVAEPDGGLPRAVNRRGGMDQIRSFHAPAREELLVEVEIELDGSAWLYRLELGHDDERRPLVRGERVECNGSVLLDRPDRDDRDDRVRLLQTHLEQVNANKEFRPVAEFLASIRHLHVVPQLIRDDHAPSRANDPHGSDFIERMASTPENILQQRLERINAALRVAVPQLEEVRIRRDSRGIPHLESRFTHWRRDASWQNERSFSDGTLRLLGLLWAFLDGEVPLLLEEPELSLHKAVVHLIPSLMAVSARHTSSGHRQIVISTHSPALLTDEGIALEEMVVLEPGDEGTAAWTAATKPALVALSKGGLSAADVVLPYASPPNTTRILSFGA